MRFAYHRTSVSPIAKFGRLVDNAVDGLSTIDTGFLSAQVLQFFDTREILATA